MWPLSTFATGGATGVSTGGAKTPTPTDLTVRV